MANEPVIENQAIEDLRALSPDGGNDFLRELIEIYLQDVPARLGEIDQGLAAPDAVVVARAAHTIKGSSSNFGARRLADAAHEVERHGKAGDLAAAAAGVAPLRAEFALVAESLKQVLAGL